MAYKVTIMKKKKTPDMSSLEPMFQNRANRAFRENQPTTAC